MSERRTINGGVIAMENYGAIGQPRDEDRLNILEQDELVREMTSQCGELMTNVVVTKSYGVQF